MERHRTVSHGAVEPGGANRDLTHMRRCTPGMRSFESPSDLSVAPPSLGCFSSFFTLLTSPRGEGGERGDGNM